MRRVKWISTNWSKSLRELGKQLAAHNFSLDSAKGFQLTRTRDGLIEGKYIERVVFNQVITDPFGQEVTYERIEFPSTEFILSSQFPEIELKNAPRSTLGFSNQLLQITNFKLEWLTLDVDVLKWAENLEELMEQKAVISQIEVDGLKIDEHTTLAALLKSTRDVRSAFRSFTQKRPYKMDRLILSVLKDSRLIRLDLRSDCSARFLEEGDSLLPIIREAIPHPK